MVDLLYLSETAPTEIQRDQLASVLSCYENAACFSGQKSLSIKDQLIELPKASFYNKTSVHGQYLQSLADPTKPFLVVDEETLAQVLSLKLLKPLVYWASTPLQDKKLVKKLDKQQVRILVTSTWLQDSFESLTTEVLFPAYLPKSFPKQEQHASFIVGAIAPLEQNRGHETLLRAVHSTREMLPQLRVILVGDGEEKRKIQWLITHLHLKNCVQIVSRQEQYERFITNFDVLVAPSTVPQGWNSVIPHALSQGVPVIAAKTGANINIITHGKTGLIFEPENSTVLAQHLVNLYNHPEWRETYANAGKNLIKKSFDQASFCKNLSELLVPVL